MANEIRTANPDPARTVVAATHADPAEEAGDDDAFESLRLAYQGVGGLALGDDLARLLEDRDRGDYVSLARLIASNRVFGFEWQHGFWIPMFQFDLSDLSARRGLRQVLGEMSAGIDGWRLAAWFVAPNARLTQGRPVDLLDTRLADVLRAARADRFVVAG